MRAIKSRTEIPSSFEKLNASPRMFASRAASALENAQLYHEVQQADRQKNEFLSMLAHELRNPLAPIRNANEVLRQKADDIPRVRWAQGVIDFAAVIALLKQVGYRGYLSLEYEHDPWMDSDKVDVISETIKMRDLVRPLLEGR